MSVHLHANMQLKHWCELQLESPDFEQHNGLGKAIAYFLRHFHGLTEFCRTVGISLDTNRVEETLKIIIRGRKSYYFFKTENGAGVANVLTSIIATAWRAGINVYDYLVDIQKYKNETKLNPSAWTPYRYKETIAMINKENQEKNKNSKAA